jgi:hexosaminidase
MKFNPHISIFVFVFIIFVAGCSKTNDKISAEQLKISWRMGANHHQEKSNFISAFTIVNKGGVDIAAPGWNIYFNFPRRIKSETVTGNAAIRHINGDFFELSPLADFNLPAGDSVVIEFVSSDWAINYSDAPAGLYLVTSEDGKEDKPQIITDYTIVPFTNESQTNRSPDDHMPVATAGVSHAKYAAISPFKAEQLQPLVPAPVHYVSGTGKFIIDQSVSINAPKGLENEKAFLESSLADKLQHALASTSSKSISLAIGNVVYQGKKMQQGSEAYQLEIKNNGIEITGADEAGVFYGIQSLISLMPAEAFKSKGPSIELNEATVIDFPRFAYRGIHLDVARNFQTKETVKKMLDLMAHYKLNKFHFHLSDDEGWRVEMETLPELTTIGGYRGHDKTGKGMVPSFGSGPFAMINESNGSGFYTQEDFIEILRYANERHIEVIPKIDMPGHARAAIKAMDYRYEKLKNQENTIAVTEYLLRDLQDSSQYSSVQMWNDNVICVCQESTYNFIKTIVDDFVKLYEKADVPFNTFHIGADEVPHGVWEKSPACQQFFNSNQIPLEAVTSYFFKRVAAILKERNLNMGGWEEIALKKTKTDNGVSMDANPDFVKENFRPYVWNNVWGWEQEDVGYKLANAGYKTVLGNVTNLYFDLAYEKNPEEIGYYWGAFIDTKKVYEFNPFNIYLGAKEDKFGNPLDLEKINSKVKLTEAGKKNILGIQGQLWAENLKGREVLEYMAFPKLLALAERAWTQQPSWSTIQNDDKRSASFNQEWVKFTNTLGQKELPKLDYLFGGVNYRISPPGGQLKSGTLTTSVEYPGLVVRYTTDGTEPGITSTAYTQPVQVNATMVRLKAFNTANRGSRTVVVKAE